MTAKQVESQLKRIYYLKKEIKARERMRDELMTQATHITSVLSQAKVFTDSGQSLPENYAVRSYELLQDLDELTGQLMNELNKGMKLIGSLSSPLERSILIDYHVNAMKLERICDKYHYSYRQIYNIRMAAYRKIADNFR